ncbi:Hypothetical_protein [Hexamita inflata]|uniref:Hypothetical_protein n=1 Tax=Hexamita inflata TaxID=28002 RepID=A0AA86NWC8_9EUKA|nr:Hypothetical protein HINF_LOCUS15477 [Hexamita inflata]
MNDEQAQPSNKTIECNPLGPKRYFTLTIKPLTSQYIYYIILVQKCTNLRTTMRYFITGIYNLQQHQILMHLNSIGTVTTLTIMNDANGNSRGFAFADGFFKSVPAVIDVKTQLIVVKNAIPAIKSAVANNSCQNVKQILRGGTFWAEVVGEIVEGVGENEESCEFSE